MALVSRGLPVVSGFSRMTTALASALLAFTFAGGTQAQSPSLDDVLRRAAAYVDRFHTQLSGIVAEETYTQWVVATSYGNESLQPSRSTTLRADLVLVKASDANRYVELRDVFEVNGTPIRARDARVERLIGSNAPDTPTQLGAIIRESARHNIGSIERTINTPLMALLFLQADFQERFKFRHDRKQAPVFGVPRAQEWNDAAVFRVSTEMWTIEFEERGGRTVIRDTSGRNLPARGRFWINPANGAVLISELRVETGSVRAQVTVSYQSEPLMGLLVPVEMREAYERRGERIDGHAVYGRFRTLDR
jgi:hypothetical protein